MSLTSSQSPLRSQISHLDICLESHLEIPCCVLPDIDPLGPLPSSHSTTLADTPKQGTGTADHMRSLDDWIHARYSITIRIIVINSEEWALMSAWK